MQVLYNGVKNTITYENGKFDRVLGEGAAQQIEDVLMVRFNMNGQSSPGRKVGMLDEVHLWCLLMDPFSDDWC